MLAGVDVLVIDLQDVGARYYTFIWTMLLCLEACAEQGKQVMVLDRPNPLGGAVRRQRCSIRNTGPSWGWRPSPCATV